MMVLGLTNIQAQNQPPVIEKEGNDTTKIKVGDMRIWIFNDKDSSTTKAPKNIDPTAEVDTTPAKPKLPKPSFWDGINLGINGLASPDINSLALPASDKYLETDYGSSPNFHLNFGESRLKIYKNYVSLVSGLGLNWNSFGIGKNYALTSQYNKIGYTPVNTDSITFSKNKLRATWLEVPLMLGFCANNLKPNKGFRLAAGVVVGYRVGAKYRQHYDRDGLENKITRVGSYGMNSFLYKATVRMYYGDISIYANYALNSLFKKDLGPDVRPFEIGIAL
jgi:hypothetical protein